MTHETKVPMLADDLKSKHELEWIQGYCNNTVTFIHLVLQNAFEWERKGCIIVNAHGPVSPGVCCFQGCHPLYVPKQ